MLVPAVLKPTTAPPAGKGPPEIGTAALDRFALSKAVAGTLGEMVTVCPWLKASADTTDVGVGGWSAMLIVVNWAVLAAAPSLTTQETVRVELPPLLLGLTPDEKVTLSRTA